MKIAKNPDFPGVIEITGSSDGPRAVIFEESMVTRSAASMRSTSCCLTSSGARER